MSNLSWKGTTLKKGPLNMFSSSALHMYCRPGLWCLLFYLSYANEKCSWPRHNHDTCLLSKVTDVTTILSTCFQRRRKIWRAFLLYSILIEEFSLLDLLWKVIRFWKKGAREMSSSSKVLRTFEFLSGFGADEKKKYDELSCFYSTLIEEFSLLD